MVIDFNGPPMAANTCDALCLPDQAVADVKGRVVRQVSFAIVQALFTEIMNVMRVAVAHVLFTLTFVRNCDWVERAHPLRLQMLLLETTGEFTERHVRLSG
jgi:hypothetical protein